MNSLNAIYNKLNIQTNHNKVINKYLTTLIIVKQKQSMFLRDQQIFIDSLIILIAQFQAANTKLISKRWSITRKIEELSTILMHFKTDLYKNLIRMMNNEDDKKNSKTQKNEISQKLKKQLQQSQTKLKKLQLHCLLKKKIRKMQRESMMHSIQMSYDQSNRNSCSESFIGQEDPEVAKLKHSVLLIEKDLGINQQQEKIDDDVSFIVHRSMAINSGHNRSMLSVEGTPIAHRQQIMNQSVLSNISDLKSDEQVGNFLKQSQSNRKTNIENKINIKQQEEFMIYSQSQQKTQKQRPKTQTSQRFDSIKQQRNTINSNKKPPIPHKASSKKKKSTVYSSKESVLGNLLEQSYNMCLEGSQQK